MADIEYVNMLERWKGPLGVSHALGVVGDKGPEGEQGPPGHSFKFPPADHKLWQGTPRDEGITLQDTGEFKKAADTETGAVVLMPQEFDADNLQAYIQQEIEAGIKEHQTSLMRKVADVLADTITEGRQADRAAARAAAHEQSCRVGDLRAYLDAHRMEAAECDKKRALDIAELETKVAKLEVRLKEKAQETKVLREKLHGACIKKPVRKIKRRNHDGSGKSTPKP